VEILVLLVIIVAVVWWLRVRNRRQHGLTGADEQQRANVPSPARSGRQPRAARLRAGGLPPANTYDGMTFVRLSATGRQPVAGESHYQPALHAAAGGRSVAAEHLDGALEVTAALIPEPRNRHDKNAVRVDIAGRTVGYLPRHLAIGYAGPLNELARRGMLGTCPARIMGGGDRFYGVHLHLAEPADLLLANLTEDVPIRSAVRQNEVSGEQDYQEHLEAVAARLAPGWPSYKAVAELRVGVTPRGKYAGDPCVEVYLEQGIVGRLSRVAGDRCLPAMQALPTGTPALVEVSFAQTSGKGWQVTAHVPW
jgi:hypothetical protein